MDAQSKRRYRQVELQKLKKHTAKDIGVSSHALAGVGRSENVSRARAVLCLDALFRTEWPGTCRRAWCESPSRLCGFFSSGTERWIGRGRPGNMEPVKYVV